MKLIYSRRPNHRASGLWRTRASLATREDDTELSRRFGGNPVSGSYSSQRSENQGLPAVSIFVMTLIALIAFSLSILTPLRMPHHTVSSKKNTSLFTLNVCQASVDAFSARGDIFDMRAYRWIFLVDAGNCNYASVRPIFKSALLVLRRDHPPEA
jgi:hypothetical protein